MIFRSLVKEELQWNENGFFLILTFKEMDKNIKEGKGRKKRDKKGKKGRYIGIC